MYNHENQIGCGYCAHERSCNLRASDPRNWAQAKCPGFIHHTEEHINPEKYDRTAAFVTALNSVSLKFSDQGTTIEEIQALAIPEPKAQQPIIYPVGKSKYHK